MPGSVLAPLAIVVIDTVVVRIFMGQVLPLTTRTHNIENRIDHLAQIQFDRTPWTLALGIQKRLENFPLLVSQGNRIWKVCFGILVNIGVSATIRRRCVMW